MLLSIIEKELQTQLASSHYFSCSVIKLVSVVSKYLLEIHLMILHQSR